MVKKGKSRLKFYVGVDMGTTCSGLSYVLSDKKQLKDIEIIYKWPDEAEVVSKVPSTIAFASENEGMMGNRWGFSVTGTMRQCTWFKLLLDRSSTADDPAIAELREEGKCNMPEGMKPEDVCAEYLTSLYHYLTRHLEKKFSAETLETTPIGFWVTVPATWSDAAKNSTLQAARTAGFGTRSNDTLSMITEPEAAALAALQPHIVPKAIDPILPGENILVCDCGGGTVDIMTYTIKAVKPKFQFEELLVGVGGKCGSTYIDRNFMKWMQQTFGQAYEDVKPARRLPGSSFMRSFEMAKKNFGSTVYEGGVPGPIQIHPIWMADKDVDCYDPDEGTVTITAKQMQSFFEPVMAEIGNLLRSQVRKARDVRGRDIDRIILVGGFGDSEYLHYRMKRFCNNAGGIKLTCPPNCQAAVVKGAALRGLQDTKPQLRLSRRHYGYPCWKPFREGIDEEKYLRIDEFDGRKYCVDRIEWVITKGEPIDGSRKSGYSLDETISKPTTDGDLHGEIELLACDRDEAPDNANHYSVDNIGTVHVKYIKEDFDNAPARHNEELRHNVRNITLDIEVDVFPDTGVLSFNTKVGDRKNGEATISFVDVTNQKSGNKSPPQTPGGKSRR